MNRKGQHFLLSAKARSLSLMEIFGLSDDEAFELFRLARWSETEGEAICPCCGSCEKHYFLQTRKQWRCKDCNHTFSITSGTLFAHHKKPLKVYLAAIALYTNTAKGFSALQLSRDLNVQYKTAFVLMHKLRESLAQAHIQNGTVIHADEATGYDTLHAFYEMKRINHQERYSGEDGECTNQAESYFSRFRRMHKGQVHKMSNQHLHAYANECAYREDTRRWSTGKIFNDIATRCAKKPTSRNWCGYWQGNRSVEQLAA